MKIAYISYPAFADCDYPLVRALRELGNDVAYYLIITPFHRHSTLIDISQLKTVYDIIPGDVYPEIKRYDSYLDSSSIRIVNYGGNSKWKNFCLWKKLHKELWSTKPDIIQLTHFFPPYALYYYLTFRKRMVITIHDAVHHTGEYSRRDMVLRRLGITAMRGFVFLSHNEVLINAFKRTFKVPDNKIHYAALAPYDCLTVIPCDQNSKRSDFLFIGRISPYKGVDKLLEAMALLSQKKPDAKLIVAGAGEFWFDIAPYKNNPSIEFINRFISPSELVSLIHDTQYVVCPYTEGTQSGVIMSSFALGKPVIATRVGNFQSLINDNQNGFLVEANNVLELARVMERAIQSSTLESMSKSVQTLSSRQSWKEIARLYIKAYQS